MIPRNCLAAFAIAMLFVCVPAPNVFAADGDGDGYDASVDCDDGNASINPGATEVCDAVYTDEDCDGAADDADAGGAVGKTNQYADADGDGYGAPGTFALRC